MSLDAPAAPIDTRAALAERVSERASSPSPDPTPSPTPAIEAPAAPAAPATEPAAPTPAAPVADPGLPAGSPAPVAPAPVATAEPTQPVPSTEAELRAQLAAASARIREFEARIAGQPAPPPAVPGTQPPVAAAPGTPLPGQALPVPAAEPAPFVAPSPEQVEATAHRIVQRDPQMNSIQAQYHEAGKLVGDPERGIPGTLGVTLGPSGYRVPDLDRRILSLEEMLDPAKAAQAGWPILDELQAEDLRAARQRLLAERRDKIDTYRATQEQREFLSRTYQARFDVARQVIQEDIDAQAEVATHHETVQAMAVEMARSWPLEFQAAVRTAKVNEQLLPKLWEKIKSRGLLASPEETQDLPNWMAAAVTAELADWDTVHRLRSGEYARAKEADAAIANGTAAPGTAVPAAPPRVMSYDEQREKTKALLAQRAALHQRRTA